MFVYRAYAAGEKLLAHANYCSCYLGPGRCMRGHRERQSGAAQASSSSMEPSAALRGPDMMCSSRGPFAHRRESTHRQPPTRAVRPPPVPPIPPSATGLASSFSSSPSWFAPHVQRPRKRLYLSLHLAELGNPPLQPARVPQSWTIRFPCSWARPDLPCTCVCAFARL